MGYIPQSFIEELLSRVDIVDVINSRVPLRKTGHNYMACCPFHQEKTPSFSVVPDKQFYNCFGCGQAGSVIKFIMTIDSLDFKDAVEKLANEIGLEIPQENNNNQNLQQDSRYKVYSEILNKTSEYYIKNLKSNKLVLDYIRARGIDVDIASLFKLGFAVDGWDNLSKYFAQTQGVTELLKEVGLWIAKESDSQTDKNNYKGYDRFRNRLMFPIRDIKGRVIGFGGRVLDDSKPKYLNSPETSLYHKSSELYGLYESIEINKTNKSKINKFIIVEGYLDVIALFQHGINYAVATLGTATSYRHLAKLFKYAPEVIYCFDGDEAGQKAAWRALENSLGALYDGRVIKFLFLPDNHDPDSYVREYGRQEFERLLERSSSLTDYLFNAKEQELGDVNLTSVEGRVKFIKLCNPLISKVPEGVYRTVLETELAKKCQVDVNNLHKIISDSSDDKNIVAQNNNPAINSQAFHANNSMQQKPSLWKRACLLLIHNVDFVDLISKEQIELITNRVNSRGAKLFYSIYKVLISRESNIKNIAEFIDLLDKLDQAKASKMGLDLDEETRVRFKNIVMQLLTSDPMITGEAAKIEFNDLLLKLGDELLQAEMDHLKSKIANYGMASLDSKEKERLQALLVKEQ